MATSTVAPPAPHAVEALAGARILSGRIGQLDGLRGVAIAMVVFYHYFSFHFTTRAGSPLWFLVYPTRFGWSGVDLFFVLSGFLIGGILLDAKQSTGFFRVFYLRRLLRIVPLYFLTLTVFFSLIAWFGRYPSPYWPWTLDQNLPRYTYFLFLQNIWAAKLGALGSAPLAVYWSLSVEEQFYLTLPLMIRFLSRHRVLILTLEMIVLAPMLRIALYSLSPTHPHAWYLLMPCRADSLFFGVLGAILLRDPAWRAKIERNRNTMRVLILLLGIGAPFITQTQGAARGLWMVSIMFTWLAAFYLLLLIYAVTFSTSGVSRVLNWTWLRGLGIIAYGVYLLHEGILGLVRQAVYLGPPSVSALPYGVVSVTALAITIFIAHISWKHFEKPLVAFSHRYKYGQPPRLQSAEADQVALHTVN